MALDLENASIRYLGDIRRIRAEPGDVLVLSCPRSVSAAQVEHLLAALRREIPGNVQFIVLGDGATLSAVNVRDLLDVQVLGHE